MKQSIRDLLKQYLDIINSEKNQKNKKYWSQVYSWNRDMWRGIPKKNKEGEAIPFTIAPDNSLWSKILNIDLREYYTDPEVALESQLRMKIYHFNNLQDNTFLTNELFIWFGTITELSYFDAPIGFFENKEGWISDNKIKDIKDIEKLPEVDFFCSGLMPRIHQYYEVFKEYADDYFEVMFPEWVRGPFCIATHLRGMQNILMDLILNPEFVSRLMRFIVDQSKQWNENRHKFLNSGLHSCKLYNDEISIPSISPKQYKEIIFPFEKELAEHYGEVSYWHSCGNTTDLIEDICALPNLKMYHAGPWTSYQKAADIIKKKNIALDICLDPERDILNSDTVTMRNKLRDIKKHCTGMQYFVRADGLMPDGPLDQEIKKIKLWNSIANEELS